MIKINKTVNKTVRKLRNNNPVHELTLEDRRRGGSRRTMRRVISDQMRMRKYCTKTCPIFNRCWARELVFYDKKYLAPNGKYYCALKSFSERLQTMTIDALVKEEEGLIMTMKALLARLFSLINFASKEDLIMLIHQVGYVMDKVYGQKHKTKVQSELSPREEFVRIVEESMKYEELKR